MASKQDIKLQNEYNEALKFSSSLQNAINKDIDAGIDYRTKLGKKVKDYNDELKKGITSLSDSESAYQKLLELEDEAVKLQNGAVGKHREVNLKKLEANNLARETVGVEADNLAIIEQVDKKAQELATTMGGAFDGFVQGAASIPVIGGLLGGIGSFATDMFKDKLGKAAMQFTATFAKGLRGNLGAMGALRAAASGFGSALSAILLSPLGIIIAIIAVIGAGVMAFMKIEKAAKAFRNETGLLNSQTQQTEQNINSVYNSTVGLGASMEDVAKAAADFTNEFGGIEQPLESTLQSMVVLNKNFGVSTKDAAAVNKSFQNMSGLSESAAQSQVMFTAQLAKASGVAPTQVMADIAESAGDAGGFFRGNTKELIKTAAFARAMGSSLKEVAAISRGLLDYQSSVTNEMEASAILGTNLNFSQSRYLAAQGDILGAQKSMVEQLRNTVDLENASIYEREALEKATGMQFDQIQNMARLQERFGDMDGERLAAAQALVANGKDAKSLTEDDLKAQIKVMETQKETQGVMESIGNSFGAIGAKLLQAFLPIGQALASMLEDTMPYFDMMGNVLAANIKPAIFVISTIFKGIGKTIGAFIGAMKPGFDAMMKSLQPIKDVFSKIFSTKGETGNIMGMIMRVFSFVGNIVGTVLGTAFKAIGNVITHIANTFGYIIDFFKGDIGFGEMVSGILGSMVEMVGNIVTTLWEGIKSVFSSLGTYIYDQVKDSLGFIGSFFGGDDSETTENVSPPADASVQEQEAYGNYKDNPIMTAKSPIEETEMGTISQMAASGDIVGAANQVAGTDMSEVVSAIKELTNVSTSNKDVYIDNEKITSRISKTQEKSNINQFGLMGA